MRPPDCPYGVACDPSDEPCCGGCASGLGPCYGPGHQTVCLTHDNDTEPTEEEEAPNVLQ